MYACTLQQGDDPIFKCSIVQFEEIVLRGAPCIYNIHTKKLL